MNAASISAHLSPWHAEPLLGREAELRQIQRLIALAQAGARQLLCIEGQPGIGKSRLAAEIGREWTIRGGVSYVGNCRSSDQQIPYQGWREILAAIFELDPSLASPQQLAHLTKTLPRLIPPSGQPHYWRDRLPLLADVLGLDAPDNGFTGHLSGELRRDNTFALVEQILRDQLLRRPLLILLEDAHWADELSLPLVVYLAEQLRDAPLLFVLAQRPPQTENVQELMAIKNLSYARTIYLEPLSVQASRHFLEILLDQPFLSPELEELLLSRGQGNPFFLQEMAGVVSAMLSNRQLELSFELPERVDLPGSIQEVIKARVDNLSEIEKLTLKIASVIGDSFQFGLLSQAHPLRQGRSLLSVHLDKLAAEKLIRLEKGQPPAGYVFQHRITQEAVYESLRLSQRRHLHATVGLALERLAPDDVERLAFHYGRSDHWPKALLYLKLAAQKAQREYANHAALNYYSQILTYLEKQAAEQSGRTVSTEYWDMLLERAKLYHLIGWRDEEAEDLGTLGLIAEALDDDHRRALAAKQWAYFYETIGDFYSALELVERAGNLAKKMGDDRVLSEAYNQWGKLLYLRGLYDTAYDYLGWAAAIAQHFQDKALQANSLGNLGIVVHYQAEYEVALHFFQEAVDLWRELGDQPNLGAGLCNLGRVYYDQGQYAEAQHCFEQSLALHRAVGNRAGQALSQHHLAKLYRSLGHYIQAQTLFEEALVFYQSAGDSQREAHTLYNLGFLYNRLGDYETALAMLEKALVILREIDMPWTLIKAMTYYGWTLHLNHQRQKARQAIIEALKIAREHQREVAMMEGAALLGQVALTLNDLSLAEACARHALKFIDQHDTQGIEHPAMVYLSCYRIWQAAEKFERARMALAKGQVYVTAQADRINDPQLRQSYLKEIPENREILALSHSRPGYYP